MHISALQAAGALLGEAEQASSQNGFANPLNLREAIKSRKKKPAEGSKLGPRGGRNFVILKFENWKEIHLVLGF